VKLSEMRIVFIGCVAFSQHCLCEVLEAGGQVTALFTLPGEKATLNSDFADLRPLAREHDIPVHLVNNINASEQVEKIRAYRPDVIFVWGWSQIIRKTILSIPRLGCIGVHPALLPANRGRHPLIWAIALGLKISGLTFFWMDEGADSGPILVQDRFPILENDDAATLYRRIEGMASKMIPTFLPKLADGSAPRVAQDHTRANTWRKRGRTDGQIDFRMSAVAINRLVRALTRPYVGAHIEYKEHDVKIWKTHVEPLSGWENVEFGKVVSIKCNEIRVRAADRIVVLTKHEFPTLPPIGSYL